MKIVILLLIQCCVLSCTTIRFVNQDKNLSSNEDFIIIDKIHHIGLLGLYEYSKPVSPKRLCKNKNVLYVETKHSLVTWAISLILPAVPILGQVATIAYSPVSVTVACYEISELQIPSKKSRKRRRMTN